MRGEVRKSSIRKVLSGSKFKQRLSLNTVGSKLSPQGLGKDFQCWYTEDAQLYMLTTWKLTKKLLLHCSLNNISHSWQLRLPGWLQERETGIRGSYLSLKVPGPGSCSLEGDINFINHPGYR